MPRPAAMPVDESPARDRGDECALGGHRRVEPPRVPPQLDKNLLDGVLGIGMVAGKPPGHRPDQPAVFLQAPVDGQRVACRDSFQEGWLRVHALPPSGPDMQTAAIRLPHGRQCQSTGMHLEVNSLSPGLLKPLRFPQASRKHRITVLGLPPLS